MHSIPKWNGPVFFFASHFVSSECSSILPQSKKHDVRLNEDTWMHMILHCSASSKPT